MHGKSSVRGNGCHGERMIFRQWLLPHKGSPVLDYRGRCPFCIFLFFFPLLICGLCFCARRWFLFLCVILCACAWVSMCEAVWWRAVPVCNAIVTCTPSWNNPAPCPHRHWCWWSCCFCYLYFYLVIVPGCIPPSPGLALGLWAALSGSWGWACVHLYPAIVLLLKSEVIW